MKTITGPCPLGNTCSKAVADDTIEHCPWHVEMRGKDATGEDHDTWRCAIAWLPILQVEVAGTNRTVAKAVQSMRNEQTKRQDAALIMLDGMETTNANLNHK